jgi:hypothetical protein
MTAYAATMAFPCPCGATTHLFFECDEDPTIAAVDCWSCGHAVGLAVATRFWSASTANGACRLRLIGWDAGHGPLGREPADRETCVWRVL